VLKGRLSMMLQIWMVKLGYVFSLLLIINFVFGADSSTWDSTESGYPCRMIFPDKPEWRGSVALYDQLQVVRKECQSFKDRSVYCAPLAEVLRNVTKFGQTVIYQTMQTETPGSMLIVACDPLINIVKSLPSQIPLYENFSIKQCLGHVETYVDGTSKESLLAKDGPLSNKRVDEDSIKLKRVHTLTAARDKHTMLTTYKHKPTYTRQSEEVCPHCDHYEVVYRSLGNFRPITLLSALLQLKHQMKIWHKQVMKERVKEGWRDMHSLAFREWSGNLGTRKNITYLVRFSEEIKDKYYEDELLLDLGREINNLCCEISQERFTGLDSYIDALIKVFEKIPDVLGTEKEEDVLECLGHDPRYSAYSRFTVDGRKKEVDNDLCRDKSIQPLTIETRAVDPHPAIFSWIMVFADTSYVSTNYKHIDNAKECNNSRKVRKKVGGIKKAEIISVLTSLKTTLIGAQASKEWANDVKIMHTRMMDRIHSKMCPPTVVEFTVSFQQNAFTAEQLEKVRNGGLTNAEADKLRQRLEAVQYTPQTNISMDRVVDYHSDHLQAQMLEKLRSLPESGSSRNQGVCALMEEFKDDSWANNTNQRSIYKSDSDYEKMTLDQLKKLEPYELLHICVKGASEGKSELSKAFPKTAEVYKKARDAVVNVVGYLGEKLVEAYPEVGDAVVKFEERWPEFKKEMAKTFLVPERDVDTFMKDVGVFVTTAGGGKIAASLGTAATKKVLMHGATLTLAARKQAVNLIENYTVEVPKHTFAAGPLGPGVKIVRKAPDKPSGFVQPTYHQAPKLLTSFPGAKQVKGKTPRQGGGGVRERWLDKKRIYEWDAKKGKVEMYNKTGKKHLGEFDPVSGEQTGPAKPNRTVEK
jgi:hypothetical protein